jgi:hypothetical protein
VLEHQQQQQPDGLVLVQLFQWDPEDQVDELREQHQHQPDTQWDQEDLVDGSSPNTPVVPSPDQPDQSV